MCEQVTIGSGFTSDWMKSGASFLSQLCSVAMQSQLLFDTQVKTPLLMRYCGMLPTEHFKYETSRDIEVSIR